MAKNKVKNEPVRFAVIGGSGLYDIPGIEDLKQVRVKTPFGNPSDAITVGRLGGVRCAFLPRHGRGHRLMPSELPARANIYALKSLGVEQIIGVGACGSLKEELAPRHFVIPDQIYDRTKSRPARSRSSRSTGGCGPGTRRPSTPRRLFSTTCSSTRNATTSRALGASRSTTSWASTRTSR